MRGKELCDPFPASEPARPEQCTPAASPSFKRENGRRICLKGGQSGSVPAYRHSFAGTAGPLRT